MRDEKSKPAPLSKPAVSLRGVVTALVVVVLLGMFACLVRYGTVRPCAIMAVQMVEEGYAPIAAGLVRAVAEEDMCARHVAAHWWGERHRGNFPDL